MLLKKTLLFCNAVFSAYFKNTLKTLRDKIQFSFRFFQFLFVVFLYLDDNMSNTFQQPREARPHLLSLGIEQKKLVSSYEDNLVSAEKECQRCRFCHTELNTDRIPLPVGRDLRTNQIRFTSNSYCCSLGCAKSFLGNRWNLQQLLSEMALGHYKIKEFRAAPPIDLLLEYGGMMTRQEWYHQFQQDKGNQKSWLIRYPPSLFIVPHVDVFTANNNPNVDTIPHSGSIGGNNQNIPEPGENNKASVVPSVTNTTAQIRENTNGMPMPNVPPTTTHILDKKHRRENSTMNHILASLRSPDENTTKPSGLRSWMAKRPRTSNPASSSETNG